MTASLLPERGLGTSPLTPSPGPRLRQLVTRGLVVLAVRRRLAPGVSVQAGCSTSAPCSILAVTFAQVAALKACRFRVWFRYQKYREEYGAEDVTIALDETPIGTFVEIEGGEQGILTWAEAIGRTPADFVLDSYRGLFVKYRDEFGFSGTEMVFAAE